jgi:hypothetical protein
LKVDKVAVMPEPEFSRTVDVSRIPAEGIRKSFNADADERENLAARFGVDKLHGLEVGGGHSGVEEGIVPGSRFCTHDHDTHLCCQPRTV